MSKLYKYNSSQISENCVTHEWAMSDMTVHKNTHTHTHQHTSHTPRIRSCGLVCKEFIIYMYVSFVRNMYSYICVSFCKEYIWYARLFCKEYIFLTKEMYIYIICASRFIRNTYYMYVSFDDRLCAAACCPVLQRVALCCSVLHCAAACCAVHIGTAQSVRCRAVLQCVALCCRLLHCVAVCCIVLQCVAAWRTMLQSVIECCNVPLQRRWWAKLGECDVRKRSCSHWWTPQILQMTPFRDREN